MSPAASNPYAIVGNPQTSVAAAGQGLPQVGVSPYAPQQIAPLTDQQLAGMQGVSGLQAAVQNYLSGGMNNANLMGGMGQGAVNTLNMLANPATAQAGMNQLLGIAGNQTGQTSLTGLAGDMTGQNQLNAMAQNAMGLNTLSGLAGNQTGQNVLNQMAGNQAGQNQLNYMASGALMDPSSNPYLTQYYNAAATPMMQNYQQVVAPNLLQQAAQSGTLGSAGMAQGFQNAQSQLANSLGNLSANIFEPAYQQGLQATQNAANTLYGGQQSAANQLLGAQSGAANQLLGMQTGAANQLAGLQANAAGQLYGGQQNAANTLMQMPYDAANAGLQGILSSTAQMPGLAQAQYLPYQQLLQSGQLGQTQAQNVLNAAQQNLNQQANWPYQAMSILGQGLTTAAGGGQSGTQIGTSTGGGGGGVQL